MTLKHLFGRHLIEVAPRVEALQQANGQFRDEQTGYTIYGQYVGYYFAWLFTYSHPDNPYCGDARLLQRAIAGWDYYASQVLPSGKVPVVTRDRYWHDGLDEWGFYYWLETLALIGVELPSQTRRHWKDCLHRIGGALVEHVQEVAGSAKFEDDIARHNAHNHFVWCVLAMYRYGQFCNDDSVCSQARTVMECITAAQLECGTWFEGETAVVGYGSVTSCAVSLFELLDNNEQARFAIDRNFAYVHATTFPNMQANDCIDGRVGFGRHPFPYTAPTFCRYRAGCAYLTRWIELLAQPSPEDGRGLERGLQGVAVLTGITAALDETALTDYDTAPQSEEALTLLPELQTRIERHDGWTVTYCGLASSGEESRWRMQRQNLVSVFHQATGLLVGGGHSVAQPEYSCFNIIGKGCVVYLHEAAKLGDEGLQLQYGTTWCQVQANVESSRLCRLLYRIDDLQGNDRARVHVPLWLHDPAEIRIGGTSYPLTEAGMFPVLPQGTVLEIGQLKLQCSADARLLYPIEGYSPYIQEKDEDPKRRQAILQVKLSPWLKECEVELSL